MMTAASQLINDKSIHADVTDTGVEIEWPDKINSMEAFYLSADVFCRSGLVGVLALVVRKEDAAAPVGGVTKDFDTVIPAGFAKIIRKKDDDTHLGLKCATGQSTVVWLNPEQSKRAGH